MIDFITGMALGAALFALLRYLGVIGRGDHTL